MKLLQIEPEEGFRLLTSTRGAPRQRPVILHTFRDRVVVQVEKQEFG